MFKPPHYHSLLDLALDIIDLFEERDDNFLAIEMGAVIEASKTHLPQPLTINEVAEIMQELINHGNPKRAACSPFVIASIIHQTLVGPGGCHQVTVGQH